MSAREDRQFLQRHIAETERLAALVSDDPLMGPLMRQRAAEFRDRLAQTPPGGPEPRTVLFFTGAPVVGSRGIDAQFASAIIAPFLEMVKTQYVWAKHGATGERGPRKDQHEAKLLLTGLPRGSFGLELAQPYSPALFADEQLSDVLVTLTDVLAAAGKSDEDLVHALDDMSPRVFVSLTKFFKVLKNSRANLRMVTGDLEVELEPKAVGEAFERASTLKVEKREVTLAGVFRGATLDTWRFDFRTNEGEAISGRIAAGLSEDNVTDMLRMTNHPSSAELLETRITTQSGATRTRYELLALESASGEAGGLAGSRL